MLDRLDDTIVAISSAAGHAPLGIVRLSGPRAFPIVDQMAKTDRGEPLAAYAGFTRAGGEVFPQPGLPLPADFYLFRAPHSYTRQDMVEIHTVGSPAVLELVRARALALGALAAGPGEFTARAFLSGAMDLATAEAVAGVIRAVSDTQLRASRRLMDGFLSRRTTAARDELAELVALIEADIDFAEEPTEFITPAALRQRLRVIAADLDALLAGSASVERLDVLPRILLFGPPNVGKSSLFNRLSGTSRAICAAAAGTTRDVLSAPIRLGRAEAILLDTAGVDQSEDELIAQGRAMTLSTAERVDLVCLVADITDPDSEHVLRMARSLDVARWLVAANKCDLATGGDGNRAAQRITAWNLGRVCSVSALDGTGVEELRAALAEVLFGAHRPESPGSADQGGAGCPILAQQGWGTDRPSTTLAYDTRPPPLTGDQGRGTRPEPFGTTHSEAVALNQRQRAAIEEAVAATRRASRLAKSAEETIDRAEFVAFELREALDSLGSVTGQVTTEDLLGEVFANFCIGK